MAILSTPIEDAGAISRRIVPALHRLGIRTIRDLLLYAPARYDDFSNVKSIRDITPGETVTVRGKIQSISAGRTAHKRMSIAEARVSDGTGRIRAVWFNRPFLAETLKVGEQIALSGKIAVGPKGRYIQSPAFEKIRNSENEARNFSGIHTGGLVAVYPETRGITSRWLRFLMNKFLALRGSIPELLPSDILRARQLLPVSEAVRAMHFPETREDAGRAMRRLEYEELFILQLFALQEKFRVKQSHAPAIHCDIELLKRFTTSLPYRLTDAQRRSIWEIAKDMEKASPMNRMLEGDVGSGKTAVAAAAILLAVSSGMRAAFMAPTEILARQHVASLKSLLKPFGIRLGMALGAEKLALDSPVVVGTHALIQSNILFENLGLIIIDEQHRFGVGQRAALLKKNGSLVPHFLSMSATPIPRTLALTVYGDLDLSLLDEMPLSRKPVVTKVVPPEKRNDAYAFIREEARKGRQVFVICPKIETNSTDTAINNSRTGQQKLLTTEVKTVKDEFKKLSEDVFPDLKIAMLHGRMKSKEKADVMDRFTRGEADVLVSTSVIEVGVDVPNATVMMIEGAERFGLATLHQFRGRVGRGAEQSFCFLFATEDGMGMRRLSAVAASNNGFEIAEKDLEIRGPGDMFGIRQWGISGRAIAGMTNAPLVREVRSDAAGILKKDPALQGFSLLRQKLEDMEKEVHFE